MNRIFSHFSTKKKYYLGTIFGIIFITTLLYNVPTWVLGNVINHYSAQKIKVYNQSGTFWNGSGLLVVVDKQTSKTSPLIVINWKVTLGLTRFVDLKFFIGNNEIANAYIDETGANLDNLNLSLSLSQVTQLSSIIKDLGLSGNLNLKTKHLNLGKGFSGIFDINLVDVSSSLSPVNPLGSYKVNFNVASGDINVQSDNFSTLLLNGQGNINYGLTLNAKVAPDKKEKMIQFITVMGVPKSNGTYDMKIF